MRNTIGIRDPVPMFCAGVSATLSSAGLRPEIPDDVSRWISDGNGHNLLLSVVNDDDWQLLRHVSSLRPDVIAIALLDDPTPADYARALRQGARSAASRDATADEIVDITRAALEERVILPFPVVRSLEAGNHQTAGAGGRHGALTQEESEWLREMAHGASVDDIAWRFGYSRRTMYRRLQSVYHRLGTARRDQALLEATRRAII